MTYNRILTRISRKVLQLEQELSILSSTQVHFRFLAGVPVAESLISDALFCRPFFVFMSNFLWPLYCLSDNPLPLNVSYDLSIEEFTCWYAGSFLCLI